MKLTINDFPIRWKIKRNSSKVYPQIGNYNKLKEHILLIGEQLVASAHPFLMADNEIRYRSRNYMDRWSYNQSHDTLSEAKTKCEEYAKQFIEDLQTEQ